MDSEAALTAYAASVTIYLKKPLDANGWKAFIEEVFNGIVKGSTASSEAVIGHIKGFLELGENNYGYFSSVGTEDGVHYKGDLNG